MSTKIQSALKKIFDKHRIVFWYDTKKELRNEFESIALDDVERVELNNNEFGLKYRMLREQPEQKFLLYREGGQPEDLDNWLLDVQLANGEFRADQVAIWLGEMELGLEFAELFEEHQEFFKASKRRAKFKSALKSMDTRGDMRLKMMAACCGADPRVEEILENLLTELAEDGDNKMKLIERCSLDTYLWQQLSRYYAYESETQSIKDFAIELFKSCFAMGLGEHADLNNDALVFMKRWMNSRQNHNAFETLSGECSKILGIESIIGQMDYRNLLDANYFKLIEMKIVSELIHGLAKRSIASSDCERVVRERRQSYWYQKFEDLYEAVAYAADFTQHLDQIDCSVESMDAGIHDYRSRWFRIDQLYRKFVYHVRVAGKPHLIDELATQVENLYTNNFLLKLNDNWQIFVDASDTWNNSILVSQKQFYKKWVKPSLDRGNKVCVVISDAMRYEVGEELLGRIRKEDRYDADLNAMLSMLPSYTQLGMAALLPHNELSFVEDESSTVFVDGQSSQGTVNREKILKKTISQAKAIQSEEFLSLNREDSRTVTKENDVVYIYHNRIDATGDKISTEGRVFEAVEETLQELVKIIKKLTAANASNIIITADHGFIYQNRKLDESDFSAVEPVGEKILYRDRRFILGIGLKEQSSLKRFDGPQLGMVGSVEVQLPKSINRLRRQGSGSRFVHGGVTLQEIIIPVIEVTKKRKSDVTQVDVDFIGSSSSVITTGQISVKLYQSQASSEKIHPRILRAGIYSHAGELISDSHEFVFDSTSENVKDREKTVRFVLTSQADESNNQDVYLRLEESVKGTSKYQLYKQARYTIRRSFTSDFDF